MWVDVFFMRVRLMFMIKLLTPVLQELRWLPVSYYLMYTVGVLAFKCVKGLAPSYLSDRLVTRSTVHGRNTRNKDYLKTGLPQTAENRA